jgi:hypothetical protein
MKQLLTILFLFFCVNAFAQNIGIGETAPTAMKLQVKAVDSAVLIIQNATQLLSNIKSSLYFKTGNAYSGGLAVLLVINSYPRSKGEVIFKNGL